jgi:hypothetical protein
VLAFDYHYETHSTDHKGNRQTHHHYFSFFILLLPVTFPELKITREGLLSKIGQALGYDDIDFESAEFSRSFCVRSKNRKFAYDVCNAQMMEYFLANRDLSLELKAALALAFDSRFRHRTEGICNAADIRCACRNTCSPKSDYDLILLPWSFWSPCLGRRQYNGLVSLRNYIRILSNVDTELKRRYTSSRISSPLSKVMRRMSGPC